MRSTLKKSLYLGLAALSFASVAGVANNASASKHHKATKTYAKASYKNIPNQGNSNVAYNVTGSNALFNKPGTVKGAKTVASKATMNDLASAKENFMVYQTAVTNRGSKYIKVVSFNKQYRGWIYAGNNNSASYGTGVNQINLSTQAAPQYSSVYLSNPGKTALKSTPEGAQFNASSDNFSHTGFVAKDKFNVDAAQTVSKTGTTWYHLVDQNDNTINGWVPSNQVQLGASNNYFDKNNEIQVNYTNGNNVVKTAYVAINPNDTNNNYANGILNTQGVADAINKNALGDNSDSNAADETPVSTSSLYNSGYKLGSAVKNTDSELNYVSPGSTVNVPVTTTSTHQQVSKLSFNVTNGVNAASSINTNDVYMPALSAAQQDQLGGNNYQYLQDSVWNNGNNQLFNGSTNAQNYANGLGTLYSKDKIATSNITNGKANDDVNNPSTNTITINQGQTFHYVYNIDWNATKNNNQGKTYGQTLNIYYSATPVIGSANVNGDTPSTNRGYLG